MDHRPTIAVFCLPDVDEPYDLVEFYVLVEFVFLVVASKDTCPSHDCGILRVPDGALSMAYVGECSRPAGLNGLGKLMPVCSTVGPIVLDGGEAMSSE